MNDKLDFSGDLKTRQEPWDASPCKDCIETYCCRHLPLATLRLDSQRDFVNLLLTSCYNDIMPVLKKTGEWVFFLKRDCRFLDRQDGRCAIHGAPQQSMICKSYNAHTCWYAKAFDTGKYSTLIRFDTDLLIWFEQRYKLIENRFDVAIDWEELCEAAHEYQSEAGEGINSVSVTSGIIHPLTAFTLPYKNCRTDAFLFFPPYNRPENRNHFEFLSFRLGFSGVSLAVSETCWTFLVQTGIKRHSLEAIQREYYPAIGPNDAVFGFASLLKEYRPFSRTGDQWIILRLSDLELLENLTIFNSAGGVQRIPSSSEILKALKSVRPC